MSLARTLFALLLVATSVPIAGVARAQDDVIPPKVLVRKFPQGQFCALPVSLTFTAPAAPIKITFTAVQFVNDGTGQLVWTDQAIDNITIATSGQVAANTEAPSEDQASHNCYIGDPAPTPYFRFNRAGLTLDLLELFDTDPTPRGWNLSDGARFLGNRSAPRNVDDESGAELSGSVGLGDGSETPDSTLTKSVSVVVSGLTEGQSYDLGAWWDANFVRFPHDRDYLTVTIVTDGALPVARKSWGALKSRYR